MISGRVTCGQSGQQGVCIYLDTNNNGERDWNELSTWTDADGSYSISNVPAGPTIVREQPTSGFVQQTPTTPPGKPPYGIHLKVAAADVLQGQNFVNVASASPLAAVPSTPVRSTLAPYTAYAWNGSTPSTSHVSPMPLFSQVWSDPVTTAATLKALPVGRRVGLAFSSGDPLWGVDTIAYTSTATTKPAPAVMQSPWLINGSAAFKTAWSTWYGKYLAAGGPVPDLVAFDEERGLSAWNLNADQLTAVKADPRYVALGSPAVTPIGFSPLFDNAMNGLRQSAMRGTLAGLPWSNYGDVLVPKPSPQYADLNGWQAYSTSIGGAFQSPAFYGWATQITSPGRNDGTNPDWVHDPLAIVIWQADSARVCASASPPVIPWLASKSYVGDSPAGWPCSVGGTPYWTRWCCRC